MVRFPPFLCQKRFFRDNLLVSEVLEDALFEAARGQAVEILKMLNERKGFPLMEDLYEEALTDVEDNQSAVEVVKYLQSKGIELPFNFLSVRWLRMSYLQGAY